MEIIKHALKKPLKYVLKLVLNVRELGILFIILIATTLSACINAISLLLHLLLIPSTLVVHKSKIAARILFASTLTAFIYYVAY